jgi:hypothetical protein
MEYICSLATQEAQTGGLLEQHSEILYLKKTKTKEEKKDREGERERKEERKEGQYSWVPGDIQRWDQCSVVDGEISVAENNPKGRKSGRRRRIENVLVGKTCSWKFLFQYSFGKLNYIF